jgi:hypothetical protein
MTKYLHEPMSATIRVEKLVLPEFGRCEHGLTVTGVQRIRSPAGTLSAAVTFVKEILDGMKLAGALKLLVNILAIVRSMTLSPNGENMTHRWSGC